MTTHHRLVRLLSTTAVLSALAWCHGAAAADFATGLSPCKSTFPTPGAETQSQINALDLLDSVTQLGTPRGEGVLASNRTLAVAINNHASAAVRARALADAQITDTNAYTLADGLGATMAAMYRRAARFESVDDGITKSCGEISTAVSDVIARANGLSGGDSNAGKYGFANGLQTQYKLPPGGRYDVLGFAYKKSLGSDGADIYGNSRPFQTAPLGTAQGIQAFDGVDFFGKRVSSRAVLTGATPAEAWAGVNGSNLSNSPSFPSGHTTFGYTEALTLAMMVPERLRALAYRGSEYGNSRIVLGAHYPLDVIAGRTLATYDLAQALAGREGYADDGPGTFQTTLAIAAADLRDFMRQNGCLSIALCAREPIVRAEDAFVWPDGAPQPASPRNAYAFRLTYGLPAIGATDLPPEPVPEAAGFLLQSRFPYLTPAQRREVLRTTEGPSGHFLDAGPIDGVPLTVPEVGAYSRLDLFAAAGGYASFADQVSVDQNPVAVEKGPLAAFADLARFDDWSNDIGGPGGLTKRGAGTLRLSGHDSFGGPANVEMGTLEIAGSISATTHVAAKGVLAGSGTVRDVSVAAGGAVAPGAVDGSGTMTVDGALALDRGAALWVRATAHDATRVHVKGHATIDGAKLAILTGDGIPPGTRITVLEADGGVSGTFSEPTIDTSALRPTLSSDGKTVYVTLDAVPKGETHP